MVIAEALNEIKDLEKRRREVQSKLRSDLFILPDLSEGEKPDSVEDQIAELENLTETISKLKLQLFKTNLATKIEVVQPVGVKIPMTLMEAIKFIEKCRYLETQFNEIATNLEAKNTRYFSQGGYMTQGEPIKLAPNFAPTTSAKSLRQMAKMFREDVRRTEQALMKANWSTELL